MTDRPTHVDIIAGQHAEIEAAHQVLDAAGYARHDCTLAERIEGALDSRAIGAIREEFLGLAETIERVAQVLRPPVWIITVDPDGKTTTIKRDPPPTSPTAPA